VSAGPTILVVEDAAGTRELLSAVLRHAGYTVVVAPTGELGVQFAAKHQPAVVLLDVHLPDIDGFTVARRIREGCGAHVLMLTGDDDEQTALRAASAGAERFLTKPISPKEIVAAVETALTGPRPPGAA